MTDIGLSLLNYQMSGSTSRRNSLGILETNAVVVSSIWFHRPLLDRKYSKCLCNYQESYAILRFIAGIGLAGELGAAVTLVAESMPVSHRGFSTGFIAAIGILVPFLQQ